MNKNFEKVRSYLLELEYSIVSENEADGIFVLEKLDSGICNMVIDCEDSLVIIEQFLFEIDQKDCNIYKSLLQKNREMIHGAFVLDESGKKIIFRDTLQIENLDLNEIQASINSLELLLSEYTYQILDFAKKH